MQNNTLEYDNGFCWIYDELKTKAVSANDSMKWNEEQHTVYSQSEIDHADHHLVR